MSDRLSTQEVADLLGVKVETVYAYASRGLLTSERVPRGRGSTFSTSEVKALARRRQPGDSDVVPAAALPRVRTSITLIEGGKLYYRGRDAVEFSHRHGFETVVGWLWGLDADPDLRVRPDRALVPGTGLLPTQARLTDRLRIAVALAAASDLLRFDLRESNVVIGAASLLAVMVESLPLRGAPNETPGRLAERLWPRLTSIPATPDAVDRLDQILVLLADHDLAVSTVAARVAASARAHPYAVVSAGLGALDSPLHGAASGLAHRMLAEVRDRGSAASVVSEYLRSGLPIPGLGHSLYPDGDPRGRALLAAMASSPATATLAETVQAVVAAAGESANVDLALAAFTVASGMPTEAGEAIFAVARTAGWIAHALEEYREPPLRMRVHGAYVGTPPA